ncbi:PREDICTED: LOW QUALITY PROTEIN: enolase-like protein ENO4 [Chaetura pelagica]|uniref:LOW QUALITY PROTEIN: enolase-like protein ENO4 n=1 Tax=Chaetura pelagica TaxID=8897 RepID=UPI000523CA26|nr:PREDICTED: LOW QUALITY PROTEIN: enolase-like protein ENO4 [Chaetura pelagica]
MLEEANYFTKLSKVPVICKVVGRQVLDGVGLPTLEVEIHCTVKNYEKRICSIVVPSHFQIPDNALPAANEADEKERNSFVNTAVKWVNESLDRLLRDLNPTDQCEVDKILGEYFIRKAEEKEIQEQDEAEKAEDAEVTLTLASCTSSATTLPGKKKAEKPGKKVSVVERMIPPAEPDEPVLCGSLAIGGTSLAIAKAGATISHVPLYLHIALLKHKQESPKEMTLPIPMFNLFNCERSTSAKLKLVKEIMLVPPVNLSVEQGIQRFLDIQKELVRLMDPPSKASTAQVADSKKGKAQNAGKKAPQALKRVSHLGCLIIGGDHLEQLLLIIQTACDKIELKLGTDMYLAINCAAHELMDYVKGKYETLTGTFKSPDEMVDMYVELIDKFPFIIALIDPLRKEDRQQWNKICCALGSKCYLIAEDAARCISKLQIDQMINIPTCSGLVLKYINQTRVSDLIELTGHLDDQRQITILGSPDGESSDDSLVDLAVGLGARFVKLGGLLRGERVTKYNRLRAIEEELAKNRTLRKASLEFTAFAEESEPEKQLSDILPLPKQGLLPPQLSASPGGSQPALLPENGTLTWVVNIKFCRDFLTHSSKKLMC